VQAIPAGAVLKPSGVKLPRLHSGDALADREQRKAAEDDDSCPKDGRKGDEASRSIGGRTVFVDCAEHEQQSKCIPKGPDFIEDSRQTWCDLGVSFIWQTVELRMHKGRYGKLISGHDGSYGGDGNIVENAHALELDAANCSQAS
jgi:hypothetical protein